MGATDRNRFSTDREPGSTERNLREAGRDKSVADYKDETSQKKPLIPIQNLAAMILLSCCMWGFVGLIIASILLML